MLEVNKLYLGDCLEIMQQVDDKSIDMINCDLPYGTTACKWDVIIPFEPLWAQYKRIIKDNGTIVLSGSQPFTSMLIMSNIYDYKESLVWMKHKPANWGCAAHKHLKYHEDIVVFYSKQCTFNKQLNIRTSERVSQGQKTNWSKRSTVRKDGNEVSFSTKYKPKNMKEYDANYKNPATLLQGYYLANNALEKTNHPTQKPVALYEYLIKTYTNEGDLVLDNCIGSGTTAIACINTGRNYIGIEKDMKYFGEAAQRIAAIV